VNINIIMNLQTISRILLKVFTAHSDYDDSFQ